VWQVFLTSELLYDGDQRGLSWWAWLVIPLAITVPPGVLYGLLAAVAAFVRWIYRGFVPAA
jgi:hypothetical protein